MNATTRFFLTLSVFSLIVYAILFNLQSSLPPKAIFGDFYIIQLLIFAVTLGLHSGLMNAGKKSNQAFIRFFMGATAVRLFIYMAIMIIYALFNKEKAFGFILHFFILYLLYTAFEVVFTFRQFSGKNSSDTGRS